MKNEKGMTLVALIVSLLLAFIIAGVIVATVVRSTTLNSGAQGGTAIQATQSSYQSRGK